VTYSLAAHLGCSGWVAVPYAPKFRRGRAKPGSLIELEVASVPEKEAAERFLNADLEDSADD
jgi:hypothetical protein